MPRYRHHLSMRPSNSQTARLASTGLVHAPCGSVPARVQSRASVVDTPSEYPVLVLRQIPLHALDRAELSVRLGAPDRLVFLIGPSPNGDLPKPQAAALHPCQCGVRMHQQGDTLRAEDRRQRLIFRWGHCPRKRLCSMSVFSRISRFSGVSSSVPLILRMASPFRADKKPPAERIRWCKPAFAPRPHSAVCAGQKLRKIVPGITTRYSGFRRFLQPRSSKGHPLPKVLFIVIMLYYI